MNSIQRASEQYLLEEGGSREHAPIRAVQIVLRLDLHRRLTSELSGKPPAIAACFGAQCRDGCEAVFAAEYLSC